MRELTQLEYKDLFRTNDPKEIRLVAAFWNSTFPSSPVSITERRILNHPMIYREQLPEQLEAVLKEHEDQGRVYIEGYRGRMAA